MASHCSPPQWTTSWQDEQQPTASQPQATAPYISNTSGPCSRRPSSSKKRAPTRQVEYTRVPREAERPPASAQRRQTPSTARHQSRCSSNTDPRTRNSPPTTPGRQPTLSPPTGNPSTPAPTSSTTKAGAHAAPTTCDIP